MKTRIFPSPQAYPMLAVAWMLAVFGVGSLRASGPAAGGAFSVNTVTAGAPATTAGASSAHVSAPAVSHSAGVAHSTVTGAMHPAVGVRSVTATPNGTPHYLPGGFAPNVVTHGPNAGIATAHGGLAPTLGPWTVPAARNTPVAPAARVHNAWTDPSSARLPNAAAFSGHGAKGHDRGNFTGQVLYPDANHDAFGNPYRLGPGHAGTPDGRARRFHLHGRGYFNPYGYYYPSVLIGGYSPFFYGDSAGIADPAGDYADAMLPSSIGETIVPSPAAQSDLARPYPSEQFAVTPVPVDPAANPGAAPVPASPSVQANTGPDSLVEAVQAELSRRGYFGGKIDAIYNPATHAAIQRFQTDQHLPASGRINEATLHALQLD